MLCSQFDTNLVLSLWAKLKDRILLYNIKLYTDDNKSKYSSTTKDILKSAKTFYEKLHTKQTSTAATTKFLSKFLTERKYLMNTLIFVRQKYL